MSNVPSRPGDKKPIHPARIVIWIFVAGVGVFMVVSGLIGVIAKG